MAGRKRFSIDAKSDEPTPKRRRTDSVSIDQILEDDRDEVSPALRIFEEMMESPSIEQQTIVHIAEEEEEEEEEDGITVLDLYNVTIPKNPDWKSWEQKYPRLALLRGQIAAALKESGVTLLVVPNPYDEEAEAYWVDLVWDYAASKVPDLMSAPAILVNLELDSKGNEIASTTVSMQHHDIKGKSKTAVVSIMNNAFGKAFSWNGKQSGAMMLELV